MIEFKDNIVLSEAEIKDSIRLGWVVNYKEYKYNSSIRDNLFSINHPGIYYRKNINHYQYYIVKEDETVLAIKIVYNDQGKKDYQTMETLIHDMREDNMTWSYISDYLVEFGSIIEL